MAYDLDLDSFDDLDATVADVERPSLDSIRSEAGFDATLADVERPKGLQQSPFKKTLINSPIPALGRGPVATLPPKQSPSPALGDTLASLSSVEPMDPALEETLDGSVATGLPPSALEATLAPSRQELGGTLPSPTTPAEEVSMASLGRITVLPKGKARDAQTLKTESKDRYKALSTLGEGAAGEVLLVVDQDIERQVAMKRLKAKLHDENNLSRFVDEIRTVGKLEHPNIVPIHDVGVSEEGGFYYIMKYVEGESLEDLIDRLKAGDPETHMRYSFTARAQLFHELLKAVHFAHSKGIIHRDIKPANIMIGRHGEVMLTDWGLAKPVDQTEASPTGEGEIDLDKSLSESERLHVTMHGSLVGTPAYMSPEQASGKTDQIDKRSDLYSLCVLFYELMTLEHPLASKKTLQSMLFAVANDPPPHPSFATRHPKQSHVPAEYGYFIKKGMAKDPAERFQSAEEMIHSLDRVVGGAFDIQCPVTFLKRTTRGGLHLLDHYPAAITVSFFVAFLGLLSGWVLFLTS